MSNLSKWEIVKREPPAIASMCGESIWVEIDVVVKHNDTGEIRTLSTTAILDNETYEPHLFIWEEGNYSCDCNRKIFWGRAIEHEYEDEETPCGDGKYSINLVNPKTGEVVYREFSVE